VGTALRKALGERGIACRVFDIEQDPDQDVAFHTDVWRSMREAAREDEEKIVYHLAALSNRPESRRLPAEYYQVNVSGTINVLQSCLDLGLKLVFMSTRYVLEPSCPYDFSKLFCERIIQDSGVPHVIFRFWGIFDEEGKDPNRWHLVPKLHDMAKAGAVKIWRPEEEVELVPLPRAVEELLRPLSWGDAEFSEFRLREVRGDRFRVGELAERIAAKYGAKVEVVGED